MGPSLLDVLVFQGLVMKSTEAREQRERAEQEREAMIRKAKARGR